MAKYSPQRFSSHSPIPSISSTSAYAAAPMASQVSVRELIVKALWISPMSLEWLTS